MRPCRLYAGRSDLRCRSGLRSHHLHSVHQPLRYDQECRRERFLRREEREGRLLRSYFRVQTLLLRRALRARRLRSCRLRSGRPGLRTCRSGSVRALRAG